MKYEVKFTSHFKKDYKLAQSAVWICPYWKRSLKCLLTVRHFQTIFTTIRLWGTIKDVVNATLCLTGFLSISYSKIF